MLAELGAQIWDKRQGGAGDRPLRAREPTTNRAASCASRATGRASSACRTSTTSQGICHVVVPQHGHIRPGMFCVGGDSHSPTGGAFGAYMFGIGATEMLGVVVTGEIWLQVPQTIFMHWDGRLADGVSAKDMMLAMLGRFGMNGGALPGGGVLRRRGARAVDARAHDAGQHERRARRAGRAWSRRTRPRAPGWPRTARRDVDIAPWHSDADAPGDAPRLRCRDAGAAGRAAAQPGQRSGGGRPRAHADRHRLHRRLHRRQARRPARRRAGARAAAASRPACSLLVAPASVRDAARPSAKACCAR